MFICKTCGKAFEHDRRKQKIGKASYCSIPCSRSRQKTETQRSLISKIMRESTAVQRCAEARKGLHRGGRRASLRSCPVCNATFRASPSSLSVFCSKACRYSKKGKDLHPAGGYREKSGRSYSGHYKGIYCGSTYELAYIIYNLDHKISFKRFSGKLVYEGETYYPDFLLGDDNCIIEIKGYRSDNVEKQIRVARGNGYSIKILYKEDLDVEFDYVKKKFSIKEISDLKKFYD